MTLTLFTRKRCDSKSALARQENREKEKAGKNSESSGQNDNLVATTRHSDDISYPGLKGSRPHSTPLFSTSNYRYRNAQ